MTDAAQQTAIERQKPQTFPAKAFAAQSKTSTMAPFTVQRRSPRPEDVQIQILYCGICHSDLHQVRNEWEGVMPTVYPCVPGHEIVGRVVKTGSAVKKYKEGDVVAVGCMVDSDRTCANCRAGEEEFCESMPTFTYNGPDKFLGGVNYGGYSESIVVDEEFVLRVSDKTNLAGTAPLVCAGITTYSPLRHWKVGPGRKVGIVGLGGLGHMGLKFAHSFGAHTVQLTTSLKKKEDALKLGANEVVVSTDANAMKAHASTFDFILDTASAPHDLEPYLGLLKQDGTLTLVGLPEKPPTVSVFSLITKRASIAGSMIGGMPETQEMLDYCGQHKITADVEVIPIQRINEAFERMLKQDVKYRFVIDMSSLK